MMKTSVKPVTPKVSVGTLAWIDVDEEEVFECPSLHPKSESMAMGPIDDEDCSLPPSIWRAARDMNARG